MSYHIDWTLSDLPGQFWRQSLYMSIVTITDVLSRVHLYWGVVLSMYQGRLGVSTVGLWGRGWRCTVWLMGWRWGRRNLRPLVELHTGREVQGRVRAGARVGRNHHRNQGMVLLICCVPILSVMVPKRKQFNLISDRISWHYLPMFVSCLISASRIALCDGKDFSTDEFSAKCEIFRIDLILPHLPRFFNSF